MRSEAALCHSGTVVQALNLAVGKLLALRKSIVLMTEASIGRVSTQRPASPAACGVNELATSDMYEMQFIGELVSKLPESSNYPKQRKSQGPPQ